MLARAWHGTVAVLVVVALIVQLVLAVRIDGGGHSGVGNLQGTGVVGRIVRVLSFFTIDSNILSGVVSVQLARRPDRDGRGWRALRLAALFGITVTGIVYSTVLARIHQPHGAAETFVNALVHYVVPIMMVAGWAAFGPRPRIGRATVLWSLAFPAVWLGYTLVRGRITGWYPYPFLDVPSHGYGRVALNAVLVTVVFAVLAVLFAVGDRRLPRAPRG